MFGAVLGGFAMGGGPFPVLLQPAELVVIGGATVGTVIISAPGKVMSRVLASLEEGVLQSLADQGRLHGSAEVAVSDLGVDSA